MNDTRDLSQEQKVGIPPEMVSDLFRQFLGDIDGALSAGGIKKAHRASILNDAIRKHNARCLQISAPERIG